MAVVFIGPIGALIVGFAMLTTRRARSFGYATRRAYLEAAPRTDAERRDAADLAVKGLVISLLGMFFAPIVLIGLAPLYFGARKLAWASMGLGLVDERDEPRA